MEQSHVSLNIYTSMYYVHVYRYKTVQCRGIWTEENGAKQDSPNVKLINYKC